MRSPGEARAYLTTLRQLLVYAGVSECSMEKGSLRVDANLSVRRPGAPLGTKTEVKNTNSFANVERALEAERARRYFPDPDLPPLVLETSWIDAQRSALPELPAARRERYETVFGLPAYDARVLMQEPAIAAYFESVVGAGIAPKPAANWVMGEVLSAWNTSGTFAVDATRLAALIGMVDGGAVSLQAAKQVYAELLASPDEPRAIAERLGVIQVRDAGALAGWVDEVLAAHPDEVARFRGGEAKLIGFFVGQVMKRSAGKADPKAIQPLLMERLRS